jgi:hypothetical protein
MRLDNAGGNDDAEPEAPVFPCDLAPTLLKRPEYPIDLAWLNPEGAERQTIAFFTGSAVGLRFLHELPLG